MWPLCIYIYIYIYIYINIQYIYIYVYIYIAWVRVHFRDGCQQSCLFRAAHSGRCECHDGPRPSKAVPNGETWETTTVASQAANRKLRWAEDEWWKACIQLARLVPDAVKISAKSEELSKHSVKKSESTVKAEDDTKGSKTGVSKYSASLEVLPWARILYTKSNKTVVDMQTNNVINRCECTAAAEAETKSSKLMVESLCTLSTNLEAKRGQWIPEQVTRRQ